MESEKETFDINAGPHNLNGIKKIINSGIEIKKVVDRHTGNSYNLSRKESISQLPDNGSFFIEEIKISSTNGPDENIVKGSIKGFKKVHIGDTRTHDHDNVVRKNIVEGDIEDVDEFRLGDE